MWYHIFKFEIKYRIKRPDTYIFFVFLLLFSLGGVDFVFEGIDLDPIKKNAPIVIAKSMAALTGIFMMIASMIMGVSVLRDFEYNIASLMFVNPIKKRDYLLGRFLGSFVILLFVFSGVLLGFTLGEMMPWRNPDNLMPFNFLSYLQPFLLIVLPIIFFGSALFFVSGALSRKLLVVYTQGIFFFVLFMLTKAITNEFIQDVLDPLSLTTLTDMVELWTVVELNSQLIPFNGVLLYNKLFWVVIGIVILVFGYNKFSFNVVNGKASKKKQLQPLDKSTSDSGFSSKMPHFALHQNLKTQCIQLMQHSIFYFKSILKEVSFWAIVISGMIIILINSISLGTVYGVNSYPKTYFIVGELQEMSIYFFIIILVFYSGELIWKERGAKLDLIYDATPVADFINLAGKFLGLLLTYVVLMLSLIISGIIFQTASGYYQYELDVYFSGFFLEIFPFLVLYTFISFFFQVIANHKFIGFIGVMVFFIANIVLGFFGFDHSLYSFGGSSLGSYSDMNGYGHFLWPYLWIKTYWVVFGILLLLIASVLSVRGTETSLKKRWKLSKFRTTKPLLKFGAGAIVLFVFLGSFIFYNTNILNAYWTDAESQEFRAGYEQTLKKLEYIPQPKIVDVNLKVELYPTSRDYTVEGYYMLKNTHNKAIQSIHIQKLIESHVALEYVNFEGGAIVDNKYRKYDYTIYTLNEALQPGATIKMEFKQTFITEGFEESNSNMNIVSNGTFFSNKDFPALGYSKKIELRDDNEREEFGLPSRKGMAKRNDLLEVKNGMTGGDGSEINFEMVIGTDSDQIAIAPGVLKNQWTEGDRAYFHYKMDKPMLNFYAIVSARYEVLKDTWIPTNDSLSNPVDLEIYYHKGHEYNLDRMMESMKMSFDYFSTNFSPYQYQQMRIMEFPRYATFAQSYPNTVPFSEAIGFMLDIDDETDIDMAFYVTAHELAHQWWGLQVVAANVQGRLMILETLAQYSALMVMRQKYPEEKIQQFLKTQLDPYLKGRVAEANQELALTLVENQDYIYYRKGAINLYAFQDYIGEDSVNLALKRFIKGWNSFDNKPKKDRYATTEDLLGYFKEATPDSLQYVIKDMFETITLYENKIVEVNSKALENGKYQVDIEFNVSKYRNDDKGERYYSDNKKDSLSYQNALGEQLLSLPLIDYLDIGIFEETEVDGKKKKNELYLKKHKITTIKNKVSIIVDKKPTEVGVDPYNKLIDKNSDDNRKEL